MALSGTSWGATNNTATTYNPFDYRTYRLTSTDLAEVYSRFGGANTAGEINFFYQLRDITGSSRHSQVAGPQWFATVYENYYNASLADNTGPGIYQRTLGGEISTIAFSTVSDILDGFNFVFVEEPEPYAAWTNFVDSRVYDVYPDPIESLCIITTEGRGNLSVKFGNPYARHFPFWWNWTNYTFSNNSSWWQRQFDWRDDMKNYPTVEPIKYIYNSNDGQIYTQLDNERYFTAVYTISADVSGDAYVSDLTKTKAVLKISGDAFYSNDVIVFTSADGCIYDASGNLAYTLERAITSDGTDDNIYICEVRNVNEYVTFGDFDDYYTINLQPSTEQLISSGSYYTTNAAIRGDSSYYGSRRGYISFHQKANFATGYTKYREYVTLPVVIANVSNGNASDNPLIFDMTVYDVSNKVVNRVKFTWDVQSNKTQDLGTFFMMTPYQATTSTPYHIETRITNRTGTRYELYRYDMMNVGEANSPYRFIFPDYWKYDLTPDEYGTLPEKFMLDAHSQIAPGLVTVYDQAIGSGYSTIDMQNDTGASFRLSEYDNEAPKDLRLNYKRVAGMTTAGDSPSILSGDSGTIQGFSMQFVDVRDDDYNTNMEIRKIVGQAMIAAAKNTYYDPAMILPEKSAVIISPDYISSTAMNAFSISKAINEEDFATTPVYYPLESDSPDASFYSATLKSTYSSDRVALQPVSIRLRIPRSSQLIEDIWENLDNAANPKALFNEFAKVGTIWVRSEAVSALDTNMFSAINSKSSYGASDCVRAFIYNDALYLDFIAILADAESPKDGMTAFIDVIEDDGVPYILIGDGAVDKTWRVSFFVDKTGANPTSEGDTSSGNDTTTTITGSSGGGGGGCNLGLSGIFIAMIAATLFRKK